MPRTTNHPHLCVLAATAIALVVGCDDAAERQARAEARARVALRAQTEAAKRAAEQAASAAKQAEQQEQAEERQKAAAEAEARGSLGACCLALARRGFEQRSMQDMDAKRVCLEGESRGDALDLLRPGLRQALGDRELPAPCAQPQSAGN